MNLLYCEADPGVLTRDLAYLVWRVHRYCDRDGCRMRRSARAALEEIACAGGEIGEVSRERR